MVGLIKPHFDESADVLFSGGCGGNEPTPHSGFEYRKTFKAYIDGMRSIARIRRAVKVVSDEVVLEPEGITCFVDCLNGKPA
jgi:hypothetical protein